MSLNTTTSCMPDEPIAGTMPVYSEPEIYAAGSFISARAVVGRITATRKLTLANKSATDGSQKPIGISVQAIDASAADAVGPTYKAGAFDPAALVIDPSFTAEDIRLAFEGTPLYVRAPLRLS